MKIENRPGEAQRGEGNEIWQTWLNLKVKVRERLPRSAWGKGQQGTGKTKRMLELAGKGERFNLGILH